MKFIQLTLYINADEAETIISFIEELKAALVNNYGDEIRENQRSNRIITNVEKGSVDELF